MSGSNIHNATTNTIVHPQKQGLRQKSCMHKLFYVLPNSETLKKFIDVKSLSIYKLCVFLICAMDTIPKQNADILQFDSNYNQNYRIMCKIQFSIFLIEIFLNIFTSIGKFIAISSNYTLMHNEIDGNVKNYTRVHLYLNFL